MKNALSLACMLLVGILLSTSGFAQSNTLFNPDYNGDGFIGVDDILGALSFYDNAWDGPVAIVIYGCTNPSYLEYDASANVDDGSCATLAVPGCTNPSYLEYDASANVDDGSCATLAVPGCTEPSYLEYDPLANVDDGSCLNSSWTCGEAITYAGVGYSTVQIGDQCWFAENLRTTTYLNGEAIPQIYSNGDWVSTTSGAMAFYNGYLIGGPAYGGHYNWYAVDDARGLCPSSWHVPTDAEWTILTDHLGGESVVADQLKSNYGWYGAPPGWDGSFNGTNSSGFSGLPGGYRSSSGNFANAGYLGYWWSSSPNGSSEWYRGLSSGNGRVSRFSGDRRSGFSVRCVRDAE